MLTRYTSGQVQEREIRLSRTPTILIVDDHCDTAHILSVFLREVGFVTLTASNGLEALSLLEDTTPDLIILDIQMPKLNGVELLSRLQRHEPTQGIPVIVYSAMQSLNHPHIQLKGVTAFVSKGEDSFMALSNLVQTALADSCSPRKPVTQFDYADS